MCPEKGKRAGEGSGVPGAAGGLRGDLVLSVPDRKVLPGGVELCSQGRSDRMRVNSLKVCQKRVRLDTGDTSLWKGLSGIGTGCQDSGGATIP